MKGHRKLLIMIPILLWGTVLKSQSNSTSIVIIKQDDGLSGLSDKELNQIGLKKMKEEEFSDAERCFLHAIVKNPANKYFYNNLSVVYMNQERYDEAYENLKTAIRIDSNYVKALSNMAITCFYKLNFIESYKYYLAARKADREYTIKRFNKKKAELRIRELYRKNPDNESLKNILNRLENYTEN